MKLGTRLLRDGVIGLSQLEAGLRAQVLYGGRLGTNLVELGFVDVDTLGRYLSRSLGAPEATKALFEAVDPALIESFGAANAEKFTAFPIARESDGALGVAVLNPLETLKLLELERALGEAVRPYTAAEIRIFFYLEKHYGVERSVRFVRTSSPPRAQGAVERRRVQGAPRVVRVEPKRSRTAKSAGVPLEAADDLIARIDKSNDRTEIGETIIRYGEGRFDVLVILMIREARAMGWMFHSIHDEASITAVDQLSLSLDELSVLSLAHGASEPYWGPPPRADGEVERQLWWATGARKSPARCLVIPVMVRDRVVQLVYAHVLGELKGELRRELSAIATHAGQAYLRLIRAARKA